MKRFSVILVLMIAGTALLSAHAKLRLSGLADWEQEDESMEMGGIEWEVLGDNLGFGMDGLVDFSRVGEGPRDGVDGEDDEYSLDWRGDVFISYHLFGNDSFIDPYLRASYGNAGYVSWSEGSARDLELSLYPEVGAGVNLVFEEGLFLGARYGYRLENDFIPGTDIALYDLPRSQVTLQLGVQFGGREKRERCDEGRWIWCDECPWDDCPCGRCDD